MDNKYRILLVDDEEAARYGLGRALATLGQTLLEAKTVDEARREVAKSSPELLLLDVNLPGESGLDYLRELKSEKDSPLVIMITAHGSERLAVEAIKAGAYDYVSKPFEIDELRQIVRNALETLSLRRENEVLKRRIALEGNKQGSLVGSSAGMQMVRSMIAKVADTDVTVLLRGESGTGKEMVAREIHRLSQARRKGNFIAVNCAALPSELIESELFGHEKGAFTGAAAKRQGKFEQADRGTLFLDEIGDMSPTVQAKLLRALEERSVERLGGTESISVDVRIVSATHRNLEEDIVTGNFRSDLFYRLRVVTIDIPALRERKEDIPSLAESFNLFTAERYNLPARPISARAMRCLVEYTWPGNVRELRNAIERAVVLAESDSIDINDLPSEITSLKERETPINEPGGEHLMVPFTNDFRLDKREFERRYLSRCLEQAKGNVTLAASVLNMHRQSLQHKIRELGLGRRYVSVETQENSDI
jgi:DNA-binding NtrC family response regulator